MAVWNYQQTAVLEVLTVREAEAVGTSTWNQDCRGTDSSVFEG